MIYSTAQAVLQKDMLRTLSGTAAPERGYKMKQKMNARQKREAEALRKKKAFSPGPENISHVEAREIQAGKPAMKQAESPLSRSPEEEAREFLDYLDRYGIPMHKDEGAKAERKKPGSSGQIPKLNLEDGMPLVDEALSRMHMGLQEMRCGRIGMVKLIHGYGSTGRGGKICKGVREELGSMKKRKQIKDFIPGEEFGPIDAASRRLAEQDRRITRDPDYGRINHGITIVIL